MGLFFVLLVIILLIIFSLKRNNYEVISPSFLFLMPFLLSLFFTSINIEKWSVDLSEKTTLVLALGLVSFVVGTMMIRRKNTINIKYNCITSYVSNTKLLIWLVIQIFILFSTYREYSILVGTTDIKIIMNSIRSETFNGNNGIIIPWYISLMTSFSLMSGLFTSLILGYSLTTNFLGRHKFLVLSFFNYAISILIFLLGGSRGGMYILLVSLFIFFFTFYYKKNKWAKKIKFRYIAIAALIVFIILYEFKNFALLMGKDYVANIESLDYLSIYLGSQIKNLDCGLSWDYESEILGKETFRTFVQLFSGLFGDKKYAEYNLFLPFNYVNGYDMGNVYTTFFPFYLDFGYLGVVFLSFIMGLISQFVYNKMKTCENPINLFSVVYGFIGYTLFFSFFSDKFYEEIISVGFIRFFAIIIILYGYFCCLHIRLSYHGISYKANSIN